MKVSISIFGNVNIIFIQFSVFRPALKSSTTMYLQPWRIRVHVGSFPNFVTLDVKTHMQNRDFHRNLPSRSVKWDFKYGYYHFYGFERVKYLPGNKKKRTIGIPLKLTIWSNKIWNGTFYRLPISVVSIFYHLSRRTSPAGHMPTTKVHC